jgi:hypothetical protein
MQEVQKIALLLQVFENGAQLLQVLEFRLLDDMAGAVQIKLVVLGKERYADVVGKARYEMGCAFQNVSERADRPGALLSRAPSDLVVHALQAHEGIDVVAVAFILGVLPAEVWGCII